MGPTANSLSAATWKRGSKPEVAVMSLIIARNRTFLLETKKILLIYD